MTPAHDRGSARPCGLSAFRTRPRVIYRAETEGAPTPPNPSWRHRMRKLLISLFAVAALGTGAAFAQSGYWAGVSAGWPGAVVHFGVENVFAGLDVRANVGYQYVGVAGFGLGADVLYGLELDTGALPLDTYVGGGLQFAIAGGGTHRPGRLRRRRVPPGRSRPARRRRLPRGRPDLRLQPEPGRGRQQLRLQLPRPPRLQLPLLIGRALGRRTEAPRTDPSGALRRAA